MKAWMRCPERTGWIAAVALCAAALPAWAADVSVSGFGTLGVAASDRPYTYQRFIDRSGTFMRDSIVGLQADATFTNEWGATVQVKAAPASDNDHRVQASASWAFVSYRPSNDWLFRVGKQRIPLYLYSQNVDVGATYDFARLPTEMYSIVSINDYTGISFSKNWKAGDGEVSLDGYWGDSINDVRVWLRDGIPGVQSSGSTFTRLGVKGQGLVLSYKRPGQSFRLGALRAVLRQPSGGRGFATNFPFVELAPGIGYFQVYPSLPGPGVSVTDSVHTAVFSAGAELELPAGIVLIGEFARSITPDDVYAPQGKRGYVAALHRFGHWTPYVTYAFSRSAPALRRAYAQVDSNTVPGVVPNAALINASQRAGADQLLVIDQRSWAVGTSYSFSAASKLKAEYALTRIGDASSLVDAPPGGNVRRQNIRVLSFSYSVVF